MRNRGLKSIVVLLLLFFGLSDIASGEPCGDELNGLGELICSSAPTDASAFEFASDSDPDAIYFVIKAQDGQSEKDHPHCLDCFCCCAHILPSPLVRTEKPLMELTPSVPFISFLPSSPSKDTFHPPRSA